MANQLHIENSSDVNVAPLGPQQALGSYLSARRLEQSMTLEQIARVTKIPNTSLKHLEAGDFAKLPGDVFVRGFLRSYARCLKLSGDDVVRRYAQCGLNPAPVSSDLADAVLDGKRHAKRPGQRRSNHNSKRHDSNQPPSSKPEASQMVGATASKRATSSPGKSCEEQPQSKGQVRKRAGKVLRDAFDLHRSTGKHRAPGDVSEGARAEESAQAPQSRDAQKRERTFIPPRLDLHEDISHRGPLTLGVIVLVIVATLTMSYLLRRPAGSVDGFTFTPAQELPSTDKA